MPASPKRNVFISHSSLNAKVTQELYAALTGRFQLTCWLDNFDLKGNLGTFSAQIVDALRGSGLLVLVDSVAGRSSDYVRREIQLAKDLQIPIRRCSIDEDQPALFRKIRIQWLAMNIQLRLAKGFLLAALSLVVLLVSMAAVIFVLGTQVVPVFAQGGGNLPDPFHPKPTSTPVPTPSDPKLAAPFHFKPDTILLQDDFEAAVAGNSFNDPNLPYYSAPHDPNFKLSPQNGSLVMDFPAECLDGKMVNECQLLLDSNILDAKAIEYFGLRARTTERTYLRGISVSLSINDPFTSLAGFGWYFNDNAIAFFHSIPALPEKNLYSAVQIDMGWHAYEILRDPNNPTLYYYIDGQLVDTYNPVHAREWDMAPVQLIIYSIGSKTLNPSSSALTDTRFEIDELVVGGFKNP